MTRAEINGLAGRLQRGDIEAWEQFVGGSRARAVRYFRFNGCDVHQADDLAQDAFLRAFVGIGGLRKGGSALSWFDAIVDRLCQDHGAARRQPLSRADMGAVEFKNRRPEEEATKPAKRPWDGLKPQERELIMLRYVDDHTEPEIAEMMGLSCVVVKLRLQRIRRKLRAGMDGGECDLRQKKLKLL